MMHFGGECLTSRCFLFVVALSDSFLYIVLFFVAVLLVCTILAVYLFIYSSSILCELLGVALVASTYTN